MVAVHRPSRPPCTILAVTVHHFAVGYAPWGAVRVHFQAGVRISIVGLLLITYGTVPSRVMRKFVCRLWLNEVSRQ